MTNPNITKYRYSMIIPVDTECFNSVFLRRLKNMFSQTNIYISIMGKNIQDVKDNLILEDIHMLEEISSPEFNYSYAVNRILNRLVKEKHDKEEIICIGEMSVVCSIPQLNRIIKTVDFKKQYIYFPIYIDTTDYPPIPSETIDSDKISAACAKRAISIRDNMGNNAIQFTSLPVSTLDIFTNQENGLEERLFTNVGRKFLIDQLEKSGLQPVSSENPGLFLEETESNFPIEYIKQDERIVESMFKIRNNIGHLQANIGKPFGDPFRVKQLIFENNLPKWKDDEVIRNIQDVLEPSLIKIPESGINSVPLKTKVVKKTPLSKQFPAKFILDHMNKKDILLVVDNKLSTIISATPLIKRLFSYFGKVNILTDNNIFPYLGFLGNLFINQIYTPGDIQNRKLVVEKFDYILRSAGSKAPVYGNIKKYFENKGDNNFIDSNLDLMQNFKDIVDLDDTSVLPCVFYNSIKQIYPPNLITIGVSFDPNKYKITDNFLDEFLSKFREITADVISYGFNVLLLDVENERAFVVPETYKSNKNCGGIKGARISDIPAIINQSRIVITHEYSDVFWISVGLHKNMIVIKDKDTTPVVPLYSFIDYCKHDDPDLLIKVAKRICELL